MEQNKQTNKSQPSDEAGYNTHTRARARTCTHANKQTNKHTHF